MILAVPTACGILLAVLTGGRVSRLGQAVPIRFLFVIGIGFIVQLLAMTWAADGTVGSLGYRVILMAGFGLTAFGFWQLRHLPLMLVPLVGLGLNLTVMLANGGTMVLTPETAASNGFRVVAPHGEPRLWGGKDVLRPWAQTPVAVLSDWINIRVGTGYARTLSPGDVVLAIGVGIAAFATIRQPSTQPSANAGLDNCGNKRVGATES